MTYVVQVNSTRYEWTQTGARLPSGTRLHAQPFASNLPGLVPTGTNVGAFLRDDGVWATPSVGGSASGLALNQLAPAPPATIVGRFSAGSGAHEDLTPTQVATMLPAFTVSGKGVVPPPGSAAGNFLRDDGTWASPGASSATGVSNAQLGPVPPLSFKGSVLASSGTVQDLTATQAAGMLAPRLVGAIPSGAVAFRQGSGFGGATGFRVLDHGAASLTVIVDGALRIPSGVLDVNSLAADSVDVRSTLDTTAGNALLGEAQASSLRLTGSGLGNDSLADMASTSVKANTGATGAASDVQIATLTALLTQFSDVTQGVVPLSGGGTTNFLRADGNWSATPDSTPTGVTNAQLAVAPTGTVKGRISGTGTAEDIEIPSLTTMLYPFSSTARGVAPESGGGTTNFLRADGAWAEPPGTGGGGGGSPGGANPSIQFNAGGGNFGGASGFLIVASGSAMQVGGPGAASVGWLRGGPTMSVYGQTPGAADVNMIRMGTGAVVVGQSGIALKTFGDLTAQNLTLASGLADSSLAPMGSGTVKGRLTGTGVPGDVAIPTLHAFAPTFTSSRPGTVPESGGGTTNFLRSDGAWAQPPGVHTGFTASGITNAQLALMPTGTVKANLSGTAAPADVAVATLHAFAPTFTSARAGTVPPSGGGSTNFLRADGTWSAPAGGSASPGGSIGDVQYNNGAGGFAGASGVKILASGTAVGLGAPVVAEQGDLRGGQSMSAYALTWSGATVRVWEWGGATGAVLYGQANDGLVAERHTVATLGAYEFSFGGATGNRLRFLPTGIDAAGQHASVRSLRVASGIPNTELSPMASGTIKAQLGANGVPNDVPIASLTAALYPFSSTTRGVAPASGGGTTNYLRADGTWDQPPGTGGSASPGGGLGNVQFHNGVGFGGASGINIIASGAALGIGVPSLLPNRGEIRASSGLSTVVATGGHFERSFGGVTALSERLLPTGLDLSNFHIKAKSIDAPHFNGLPTDQNNLKRGANIPYASGLRLYLPHAAATGGNRFLIPSGTITGGSGITLTLHPTGGRGGHVMRIEKLDAGGQPVTVQNPSGTALLTMPSGTKYVADFVFTRPSGASFELGGHGELF